jgi:hypothetical protein
MIFSRLSTSLEQASIRLHTNFDQECGKFCRRKNLVKYPVLSYWGFLLYKFQRSFLSVSLQYKGGLHAPEYQGHQIFQTNWLPHKFSSTIFIASKRKTVATQILFKNYCIIVTAFPWTTFTFFFTPNSITVSSFHISAHVSIAKFSNKMEIAVHTFR